MRVYATQDELATYIALVGSTVDVNCQTGIAGKLRDASSLVTRETGGACYDVDVDGYASDVDTLAAFRDATCAQALAWITLGTDSAAGGVTTSSKTVAELGIGSARKRYADAQSASDARAASLTMLVPAAVSILREAGLISSSVWSYG